MNPFLSKQIFQSEKNGQIVVRTFLGIKSVSVGGYQQSGPYIRNLWLSAIAKIPTTNPIENILVLGIGAGSIFSVIEKKYPTARVVAVDWDKVMIKLLKDIRTYKNHITIIEGEICATIKTLEQTFDLILIDVFVADQPNTEITRGEYAKALAKVTSDAGYIVINIFKNVDLISEYENTFKVLSIWKYQFNTLALLTKNNVPGEGLEPSRR